MRQTFKNEIDRRHRALAERPPEKEDALAKALAELAEARLYIQDLEDRLGRVTL